MSENDPLKFDSRSPGAKPLKPEPHPARLALRFMLGFFLGIGISAFAWLFLIYILPARWNGMNLIAFVLSLKVAVTIVFMFLPRWRLFGAGMLSSIAVGALIFAGMVVVNVVNLCGGRGYGGI